MKCMFVLYDRNKKFIKKESIFKLPYKKEKIIEKSIEIYNEQDPCIIYITACSHKLACEIEQFIRKTYEKDFKEEIVFKIEEMPQIIKNLVEFSEKIGYVGLL